jgi:hypothetical protein
VTTEYLGTERQEKSGAVGTARPVRARVRGFLATEEANFESQMAVNGDDLFCHRRLLLRVLEAQALPGQNPVLHEPCSGILREGNWDVELYLKHKGSDSQKRPDLPECCHIRTRSMLDLSHSEQEWEVGRN